MDFNTNVKYCQFDNGGEFQNNRLFSFFSQNGTLPHFSCPYISLQNGHAERLIRTLTIMFLFAPFLGLSSSFLSSRSSQLATLLVNILPTSRLPHLMPFEALFHLTPDYSHLCVFGCLCYPNLTVTSSLKLAPRSTPCLFVGYPLSHQGF